MVKVEELWIGDHVIMRKSKRIGTYEGKKNGKLKVNCRGKIILTTPANLELYDGPFEESRKITNKSHTVDRMSLPTRPDPELDLHIEKLNASLINGRAERILDYQIKAAQAHLETAIKYRYPHITIIHGKGEGVLKQEVQHLLSLYSEVKCYENVNDGGGTKVTLRVL